MTATRLVKQVWKKVSGIEDFVTIDDIEALLEPFQTIDTESIWEWWDARGLEIDVYMYTRERDRKRAYRAIDFRLARKLDKIFRALRRKI